MAESTALVFRVRVLAITHIVVGALLIIFGIARGERYSYRHTFGARFFEIVAGTWMCVAGGLGIPGSTPQRTQRRNCFASIFMGFAITSAVFGGAIIFLFSILIGNESCQVYCQSDYCNTYGYREYDTLQGLAAVTLALGIIEFGTGIWVSICLCAMKPCCRDLEERQPLVNAVTG